MKKILLLLITLINITIGCNESGIYMTVNHINAQEYDGVGPIIFPKPDWDLPENHIPTPPIDPLPMPDIDVDLPDLPDLPELPSFPGLPDLPDQPDEELDLPDFELDIDQDKDDQDQNNQDQNNQDKDDQDQNNQDPNNQQKEIIDKVLNRIAQETDINYTKEIKTSSRPARASIDPKTNTIHLHNAWFDLGLEEKVAVLYHEIYHTLHDFPLALDNNGNIISIKTDITKHMSESELEKEKEKCKEEANEFDQNPEEYIPKCVGQTEFLYIYICSNFYLNEINAYIAMLNGSINGWWELSDIEIELIYTYIKNYEEKYKDAIEYEKDNNLNPDGSEKE